MSKTPLQRFEDKYTKEAAGCWLWTASKDRDGYGQFRFLGTMVKAHRFAYQAYVGLIPVALTVDHFRLNPGPLQAPCSRACVNPLHVELVTSRQNVMRGNSLPARNAAKTRCPRGHAYRARKTPDGSRVCVVCSVERTRVARALRRLQEAA